jgi:hypothetical protein
MTNDMQKGGRAPIQLTLLADMACHGKAGTMRHAHRAKALPVRPPKDNALPRRNTRDAIEAGPRPHQANMYTSSKQSELFAHLWLDICAEGQACQHRTGSHSHRHTTAYLHTLQLARSS